jgi:hypothetical protein
MMPLFYLLLKRSYWIMERAHDVVLHDQEFQHITDSLGTLQRAVEDRVKKLQGRRSLFLTFGIGMRRLIRTSAIYRLQNIVKADKLQTIFFGLVFTTTIKLIIIII